MEIVYRAFDGTIFDDEMACCRYEDSEITKGINALYIILTEDRSNNYLVETTGRITKSSTLADILNVARNASLIYFSTFAARDAFCALCDSRDITADSNSMSTGWNYYSTDIEEWIPLRSIDSLDHVRQDDKNFNYIVTRCDDLYNEYVKEGKV